MVLRAKLRHERLMNPDSSEARNTTSAATSSGQARRGVRWWRSMVAVIASLPGLPGITMKPGEIALHLIRCLPNSVATYLVRLISAALDAP
jgi:hypothetical protein